MKARINKEGFKPFDLVITLESMEEVDAFYAMFNYTPLYTATRIDGECIRKAIHKAVGTPDYTFFHNRLGEMR